MPSPLLNTCKRLGVFAVLFFPLSLVAADSPFFLRGEEYPIAGLLPGDQVFSGVTLNENGGYVVWQDNATDGDGFGISARRIKSNLVGSLSTFRVNEQGAGDQQNPKVKMLKNGGAVIVWQGGPQGDQDIFARFLGPDGTFITGDVRVNTVAANQQINPVLAVSPEGNVIVTWSSFGQDGSMQGIYAQWLSATGAKIGAEMPVNQYTAYNQRTPAVAALNDGRFIVAWVSEQQRFENSVDVYARILGGGRGVTQNEFLVNTTTNICANPTINASANGGFLIGWSQRNLGIRDNGWDVFVRSFSANAQPASSGLQVNTHLNGNHYAPQVASVGDANLVVWTSAGQDGSREGIFGRFVTDSGAMLGQEFQVNTSTDLQQIYPSVASDGKGQFLVVWSSFIGGPTSFDLLAQRLAPSALTPEAPFVSAVSSTRLSVTWPPIGANTVSSYELLVDNRSEPVVVAGNIWAATGLNPASSHSFKLAYRFPDGSRSQFSVAIIGKTWGSDENLDGLPDDWQASFWGDNPSKWPDPKADSDGDGATNKEEFLAGTNPMDAKSVLRTEILATPQGSFLKWNTQLGFIYQVQTNNKVTGDWTDVGAPRFAAGSTDSMLIGAARDPIYYRVKLLR